MGIPKINPVVFTLFLATVCFWTLGVSAGTPSRGGTAVVAVTSDPGHFNPAITTGYNVHVVADSMFNGLVALDANLSPKIGRASCRERV